MQALSLVQATADSTASFVPAGLGLGRIDQPAVPARALPGISPAAIMMAAPDTMVKGQNLLTAATSVDSANRAGRAGRPGHHRPLALEESLNLPGDGEQPCR
jgi:hypothetical protein